MSKQKVQSGFLESSLKLGFCVDRYYWLTFIALLVIAFIFRIQGLYNGHLSFWYDEFYWANALHDGTMFTAPIRPFGFTCLTWMIVNVHSSEFTFRLIPHISSVAQLIVLFLLLREVGLGRKWGALIVLAFAATQPSLITFGKEFKTYMSSAFLHLLLFYWTICYVNRPKDKNLWRVFIGITSFSLFSVSIAFILPVSVLVCLHSSYTNGRKKHSIQIIVTAVLGITIILLQYFLLWRQAASAESGQYWGAKYDVFHMADNNLSLLQWLWAKFIFSVQGSLDAPRPFTANFIEWWLFSLAPYAYFLGLVSLIWRRKFYVLALLISPLMVNVIFTLLGHWPLGPFRTNIFWVAYILIPAALAFEHAIELCKRRVLQVTMVVLTIFLVFAFRLPPSVNYYSIKRVSLPQELLARFVYDLEPDKRQQFMLKYCSRLGSSLSYQAPFDVPEGGNLRQSLQFIHDWERQQNPSQKVLILADSWAFRNKRYYLEHSSNYSAQWKGFFAENTEWKMVKSLHAKALLPQHKEKRLWIFFCNWISWKASKAYLEANEGSLPNGYTVKATFYQSDAFLVLFERED
jgi:hypothetical protein